MLANKTVTFKMDDTVLGTAVTGSNGVASMTYTHPANFVGDRTITVEFAGDTAYNPAAGSATFKTRYYTRITVADATGHRGQTVNLRALLRRYPDAGRIAGKTLTFKVEGLTVGTAVTGVDGLTSLAFTIPAQMSLGAKTVTVEFAGDGDYGLSSGIGTLTVN